jgi:serine phosphatase RsbU (regulator of sigma subunit)
LGFFSDPDLDVKTVVIPQGSTLLLYTDGVFDLMDRNDKSFGEERLREMACTHQGNSAQDLCEKIIGVLKSYQGESPQFDDMALVAIQCVRKSE